MVSLAQNLNKAISFNWLWILLFTEKSNELKKIDQEKIPDFITESKIHSKHQKQYKGNIRNWEKVGCLHIWGPKMRRTLEKWVSNNIWSYDNWIYFKVDKNLNLQIQKRTTNPSNKIMTQTRLRHIIVNKYQRQRETFKWSQK